jgi:lysophospholipase L1-like esterase
MRRVGLAVLAVLLVPPTLRAQGFALQDGDRVVFYGDSITQDGQYARSVELYVATRFPEWTVTFQNAGVGGDKVSGGWAGTVDVRLDRDVIAYKPTVVTVMLGMNDGNYRAFDQATYDAYTQGLKRIVARLKEALPGVRLTLIQPSPYDDVTRPPGFPEGYNGVLKKFGAFVQELGRAEGATVVDLNTPLVDGLLKVSKANAPLARQIVPDRVHPGAAGHLVMAAALLRAWNAPPAVTRVEIDGTAAAHLVHAENTEVTGLAAKGPYLEWTQNDKALPLPVNFKDGEVELAQLAGAGLDGLDQQILKITGLTGRCEVLIDGAVVGKFTAQELAVGVNLALHDTPMTKQAAPVGWHTGDRHDLELTRRQLLVAPGSDAKMKDAAGALAALDAKMQQERRTAAKPSSRHYEVRRPYSLR